MGLSAAVARWLREQGYDAVHLSEEGLVKMPDREVFAKAEREGRVLVTCDLDFGEIVAASGAHTVSVIVVRLFNPHAERVIERLRTVLRALAQELERGAVVTIEEARLRVRALPIGS